MRGSMGAVVAAVLAASLTSASQAQGADSAVNGYVDARVCARCHAAISETYKRTGMGRSFYRPTPANRVEDYAKENTYYHRASDSYFAMIERDGKYYQRRYQLGSDGQQINILEKSVDFVVGSGNHSRTYLHRSEKGALIELPLAWYAEKGGYWAMNPGYDRPDHPDFRRQIDYSCMFCHNAYPEVSAPAVEAGSAVVFPGSLPEGIDCQRCHGPGEKHVQAAQRASAPVQEIRASITNPARLSPARESEVCMQCHLETTSFPLPHAMVRYDRGPFSYMPGEPLEEFILQFDHAPGKGYDDKFEIAGAAYRMRKSACFLKSNGALRCTTCHNPHDIPRGAEAASHYETVCRQCHSAAFRRLVASGKHSQSKDCIGCHMPKRRTDDVVHVIITDHLIQRLKPTRNL